MLIMLVLLVAEFLFIIGEVWKDILLFYIIFHYYCTTVGIIYNNLKSCLHNFTFNYYIPYLKYTFIPLT